MFLDGITIKEIDIKNIPLKQYLFKDFAEILKGNCKTERLEDQLWNSYVYVKLFVDYIILN